PDPRSIHRCQRMLPNLMSRNNAFAEDQRVDDGHDGRQARRLVPAGWHLPRVTFVRLGLPRVTCVLLGRWHAFLTSGWMAASGRPSPLPKLLKRTPVRVHAAASVCYACARIFCSELSSPRSLAS